MNYDDIVNLWNTQADEFNTWGDLSDIEKVEFTIKVITKEIDRGNK
jgi:hypothetical protein